MPVGDLPILEIILKQLCHHGFHQVTLAVGHLAALIQAYFGDGSRWGIELDYFVEETSLGTAGALGPIADGADTYLVMNGDVLTTLPFAKAVEHHSLAENAATVAVCSRTVDVALGIVETDDANRIMAYREKPVLTYSASMGVYVLGARAVARIGDKQHMDMPDLLNELINDGERVGAFRFDGYWRDIGNHDDYERVCAEYPEMETSLLPE